MSSPVRACALAGDSLSTAPPAPVARFGHAAVIGSFGPVARADLPNPPASSPRLPVALPPAPDSAVPRLPGSDSARWRMIPHRPRFRLVNPVGPSLEATPRRGHHSLEAVPRAPVGVRLPVRRLLCTPRFAWSRGIFQSTGLSTEPGRHPQKFSVRPPFVHRMCTGLCTCARPDEPAWLTFGPMAGTIVAMTLRQATALASIIIIR